MFSGSIVALVTPFFQDRIDEKALRDLVDWHCDQGTQAIVVCGSTGEGALLTPQERHQILIASIDAASKRIPIIMGCSSPSTAEAVSMVKEAESLGAAAALVVTPYYVKPMPEGIFQHFDEIAKVSSLPLIVYNNPGRTAIDLPISLIVRLATLATVVGLKDSSIDLQRPIRLRQGIEKPFCFLSGDDPTVSAYLAVGGAGCISVTANVAPKLCQELITAWNSEDLKTFSRIRDLLLPLQRALLLETNPSPLKYAVSLLGKCHNEMRLPLVPISQKTGTIVKKAMVDVGLLHEKDNDNVIRF